MEYTIDDVVDFVMEKDHLNLKAAIDDIMSAKVSDALELRKQYMGQTMFNAQDVEETDESE